MLQKLATILARRIKDVVTLTTTVVRHVCVVQRKITAQLDSRVVVVNDREVFPMNEKIGKIVARIRSYLLRKD